jgi:hypothetical protein
VAARLTGGSLADRARFAIGAGCVAVAAALLLLHVPRAVRTMDATARDDTGFSVEYRELRTGDVLGLPYDLQDEALQLIPKDADYALLLPPDADSAAAYGINTITYATAAPYLLYLLLPARPADPGVARYVICWHCDAKPWDGRTTWLWQQTDEGEAIGRVNGR